MLMRVALLGLMTLAVGGFGLIAWISLQPPPRAVTTEQAPSPPPPPVTRAILAAAQPLRPGVLLKPEDLVAVTLPEADVPAGARPDTLPARSELVGAMLRHGLVGNQPILPSHILRPVDQGFLTAVLRPGMRATTVAVDAVSGAAGLLWPGDRVDLVLTQAFEDTDLPAGRRVLGETVMTDLRVIAIDQKLVQGATPGVEEAAKSDSTVTLEATPAQVERVAVASRLGKLSLSVRSGEADAAVTVVAPAGKAVPARLAGPGAVWGSDVSPGLVVQQTGIGAAGTMRLFQGSAEGKEYKFK